MCNVPPVFGTRRAVRFALAGLTAALLAGCADSRAYLGDPLGNPFKSASTDQTPTGSYNPDMAPPAPYHPRSKIVSKPLAPPPHNVALYAAPAHQSPRLASNYVAPHTDRTASIVTGGQGGWSASGGMPIIAATGETAVVLGERYNVPTDVLIRINGFKSGAQIRPGTRVVIPVYSASAHAVEAPRMAVVKVAAPRVVVLRKPNDRVIHDRVVINRDIKGKIIVRREAPPEREIMHWAKGPQPKTKVVVVAEKPSHKMRPMIVEAAPEREIPQVHARAVDPTPTASLPPASEKIVVGSSGNPEFRWPAHGRIIQGFRTGGNDGINIAVPEGTSVKAAESGVVAYAGSEIKGFGNLVLIRHPNGYVTAYANNGSIDVHRGEQVKRGQTIAKSGQSGNVASPQLHFELRKGSTPVDPTRFLAGL